MQTEFLNFYKMKASRLFLGAVVAISLCMINFVAMAQKVSPATYKDGELRIEQYHNGDTAQVTSIFPPAFEGGSAALSQFIADSLQYPETLKAEHPEGTTLIQFMVNSDGSLSDFLIVKKSGYEEMDDEALRLVRSFPNWKAAKVNGDYVDMPAQIPIRFKYMEETK